MVFVFSAMVIWPVISLKNSQYTYLYQFVLVLVMLFCTLGLGKRLCGEITKTLFGNEALLLYKLVRSEIGDRIM